MNTKVHFEDIIVLEDNLLGSGIGRPVSSYIVQAESSWEPHTGFQSIPSLKALAVCERTNTIFNLLGKLAHGNARLCDGLCMLADLAVDFGSFAIVI